MSQLSPKQAGPAPATVLALMGLVSLIWGSTWLAIKYGLTDVPPFTAASIRFFIAGSCMALLAHLFAKKEGGVRPPRSAVIAQGLLQFGLNYALVYVGETVIPSGLVSVLWSIFPLCVAFASHYVLKTDRLATQQWLGFGLSFLGVASLFITDIATLERKALPLGLLLLLAPLSVTVSTLLIKRTASGASSLLLNRDSILLGAGVLGVLALLFERDSRVEFTAIAVASIAYLAIFGTVLTFGVYLWLLRFVPAYRLSLNSFVTPVVALLFGAAFGNEPLTLYTLAGSALVLSGVLLVLRPKK